MSAHVAVTAYIVGDEVHVHDRKGWGAIPTRYVHLLANTANQRDDARANWAGRWYDRDLLNSARDLLDSRDDCRNCKDEPGTEDMGEAGMWCASCCSASQGSIHDDKGGWS